MNPHFEQGIALGVFGAVCALLANSVTSARAVEVWSEGFETDGNSITNGGAADRYTTTGEFSAGVSDYYQRINNNGTETPNIDLDGIADDYTGFTGNWFFAAEDTASPDFRIMDFEPITTASFENMVFTGDFAMGDNDSGPSYDSNHFIAVLYSTDGGSNYKPGLLFRHDGNNADAQDATNQPLAKVTDIQPSGSNGITSLELLGAQISTGVIAPDSTDTSLMFNFIAADSGGFAASGIALTQKLSNGGSAFMFPIDNAPTVRIRVVLDMDDTNCEVAFDNFAINGDPILTNVAPSVSGSSASDVTQADIGGTSYSFTVSYADDSAIDVSDINTADVTVTGPAGVTIATASEPSGTDGTPRTATYSFTPPGGSWDGADNGTYTITMVDSQVSDDDASPLFVPAGAITTFNVDATNTPPVVDAVVAENVTAGEFGDSSYSFDIIYTDATGVLASSIGAADVTVTTPGGVSAVTGLSGSTAAPNATTLTATYSFTPPGGVWDLADNGTYTIGIAGGEVLDINGGSVAPNLGAAIFTVDSDQLLCETFETDGNGSRYSVTGTEFHNPGAAGGYFTRIRDTNGNAAGGETPAIDLDGDSDDEYDDFVGEWYFAMEDVTSGGGGSGVRVLEFNPINSAGHNTLMFTGLFGAGDTDSNPAYDSEHFLAVLYSIDAGTNWTPGLVIRANVNAGDQTNHPFREVDNIAPSGSNGSTSPTALGNLLAGGDVVTAQAAPFSYMLPDSGGDAATGIVLTHALQSFGFSIPGTPTEVRLRVVTRADELNGEIAFDQLKLSGAFTGVNTAPTAITASASSIGEPEIGDTSYSFTVTYADNSGIDISTIDTGDVTVTGSGGIGNVPLVGASVDIASNGTPRVGTYTLNPPGGSWDTADNGVYTIKMVGTEVGDNDGTQLFVPAGTLGTFNVAATNTDPSVSNSLAEDVIVPDFGDTSYSFTIEYSDTGGIDASTIGTTDVTVTGPAPLFANLPVTTGSTSDPNGSPVTATYIVTPPGGDWDASDAGTYTIAVIGSEISDVVGASVAANPAQTTFDVGSSQLLCETFETDGNGPRYSVTGTEFHNPGTTGGYYTRIRDTNGNTVGGDTPPIDLDGDTHDEYTDFIDQWYFAMENVATGGGGSGFRVLEFDPINSADHSTLSFTGLFGAGDTDSNPAYDSEHFLAVLYSTDAGTNWTPGLVFRANVNAADQTNHPLREVDNIAPSGSNGSTSPTALGNLLAGGDVVTAQAAPFSYMMPDSGGDAATGIVLTHALQSFGFSIPGTPTSIQLRVVTRADELHGEMAFDDLKLSGTPLNNPPIPGPDHVNRFPSQSLKIAVADLLANDSDPEDGMVGLSITGVNSPTINGAIVTLSGGTVFYNPNGYTGVDVFTYTVVDTKGAPATGVVSVLLITDPDPTNGSPANLISQSGNGDGSVVLVFAGIPGRSYRVQTTGTLLAGSWVDAATIVADAQGRIAFHDSPTPPSPRFYRTVSP